MRLSQHLHRIVVENGRSSQCVPDQSGHHGSLDALARNVTKEEAPRRARQREEVIEIAANIVDRRREEVVGGIQAVRRGEQRREQCTTQRLGEDPNATLLGVRLLACL